MEHAAVAAVGYEEIYRLFRRLFAHELARGVVCALIGKAIAAAQVAVVADMYAQRLYIARLDGAGGRFGRVQQPLPFERTAVLRSRIATCLREVRDTYVPPPAVRAVTDGPLVA